MPSVFVCQTPTWSSHAQKRQSGYWRQEGDRKRTGDFKRCEIAKVVTIDTSTPENVNNVVYERGCMSFSRGRDEANALQFSPLSGYGVERPSVVIMVL